MVFPHVPKREPTYETVEYEGARFNTVFWQHEGESNGKRIVFVHGFAERVTLYNRFFEDLTEQGYDVWSFDQRGFGKTGEKWQDRGYTHNFYTFRDLDYFVGRNLESMSDSEKLCLMGHSMGGGIVIEYASIGKYRDRIDKMAVTGPEIILSPEIQPSFFIEWSVRALCKVPYLRALKFKPAIQVDRITHNKEAQDYIKSDPLCEAVGTMIMLRDMVLRGRGLVTEENYRRLRGDLPILIVQGESDVLSLASGAAKFVEESNRAKGNNLREVKFIPKCFHSCLIEDEGFYTLARDYILEFLAA